MLVIMPRFLFKILLIFFIYNQEGFYTCAFSDDELDTIDLYFNSPLHSSEQIVESNTTLTNFISEYPTKVIIHGYISNRFHASVEPLKNAYLGRGDANVIMVDWDQIAHKFYDESRKYVHKVGYRVGRLLSNFIKNHNVDLNYIHIIGHSLGSDLNLYIFSCITRKFLGAHIAGNVGRYFDGQLSRITGLDPAAPLFTNWSTDAIKKSDGQFVDIIHTGGHILGEIRPRGHVDFWPNSGTAPQPGCGKDDLLMFFTCSHFRAPLYYAESILFPSSFIATKCTLSEILSDVQDKCSNPIETSLMGDSTSVDTRGIYYLTTYDMYPFGRGNFTQYGNL